MDFLSALHANADDFARLVGRAPAGTPIAWCDGWDLAELAVHVGSTHRWTTAMISGRAAEPVRYRPFKEAAPTDPARLADWLAEGADALCATIAATDPDAPMWTWTAERRAGYWTRRMVHEMLVHRADATWAVDGRVDVPDDLARDGIVELLDLLPAIAAGRRVEMRPLAEGRSLAFAAGDGGPVWRVDDTADGFAWRTDGAGDASARVTGPPEWLYLWLWGRDGDRVTIDGDPSVAAAWRDATRV